MKPETKEARITIRAKASQRDLIDMAANFVSKSRTDFMLEAACRLPRGAGHLVGSTFVYFGQRTV